MTKLATMAVAFLISIATVFHFTTPYMAAACASYFILCVGLLERRNKTWHPVLMISGIAIDLTLVLVLEYQRSAIHTAIFENLTILQRGHIGLSTLATLFYIPTVILGIRSIKQKRRIPLHLIFGKLAFLLRTGGFILMFSLLDKVSSGN